MSFISRHPTADPAGAAGAETAAQRAAQRAARRQGASTGRWRVRLSCGHWTGVLSDRAKDEALQAPSYECPKCNFTPVTVRPDTVRSLSPKAKLAKSAEAQKRSAAVKEATPSVAAKTMFADRPRAIQRHWKVPGQ